MNIKTETSKLETASYKKNGTTKTKVYPTSRTRKLSSRLCPLNNIEVDYKTGHLQEIKWIQTK
jgi:hypothetical protein